MGTRSLTIFRDEKGKDIVVMYRQMDGYPKGGHGQELAEFLKDFTMVNGISYNETRKIANGMGCLAAQVIAHFKDGAGGIYLYPAGTNDVCEEYVYIVTGYRENEPVVLFVNEAGEDGKSLYSGTAEEVYYQIIGEKPPAFDDKLRDNLLDYKGRVPEIAIQMAWKYRFYKADPASGEVAANFFRKLFPEDSDYYRVINGICKHHPL
jgi:hypothetical protein